MFIKKLLAAAIIAFAVQGRVYAGANYVIKTEEGRVYTDYGASSGIKAGDSVDVYEVENIKHPVTGKMKKSRVLLEKNVRVLTSDKTSLVILLPDSRISDGMEIELEKTALSKTKGASGIFTSAEGIFFTGDENIYLLYLGYGHTEKVFGFTAGGGLADNNVDKFYYVYAGPQFSGDYISGSAWASMGVTEKNTKIGGGAALRMGYQNGASLSLEYGYFPTLGSSASLEMGAGFSGFLSPILRIGWSDIPEESDAVIITGGFEMRLGNFLLLKPYAGAAALDVDNISFTGGLSADIRF
ncbi:MAG: hypothetical protein GX817_05605 [Elusimicrobia bacterium]|nr:hypothetical protein [Elusimicrobiota bacterium]